MIYIYVVEGLKNETHTKVVCVLRDIYVLLSIYNFEIIEKKIQDAFDIIKSKQLVDQESVSRHNVSIGKIQAWQEMLDIAEPK